MIRMVWFYEFRGGINGWDLKISYTWFGKLKKLIEKKMNWIEWFVGLGKLKKLKKWME